MELNDKQKKTLKTFCLLLGSYGTKMGKLDFNFYNDRPEMDTYSGFHSPDVNVSIDAFDAIYDLAEEITMPIIEDDVDYYDQSGCIRFCVDCLNKTILFEGYVNEMNTNYSTDEYSMEELNEVDGWNEFLGELRKYKTGRVTYEGSGDSGFIEENMKIKDKSVPIPAGLETWLYEKLEQYGGWEINEGSQGYFDFNFKDGTIYHEHGENYEDTVDFPININIKF
jgi:hypothetical protein